MFSNVFQAPALSVGSSGQRSLALRPLSVTDLWLGRLIDGASVLVFRTAYSIRTCRTLIKLTTYSQYLMSRRTKSISRYKHHATKRNAPERIGTTKPNLFGET